MMIKRLLIVYIICIIIIVCTTTKASSYDELLHVHLIPHSHCDPGWLQTVDFYYENVVRHILNTVIASLHAHGDRRFVWAEISFFRMWWDNDATEEQQLHTRTVLKNKQFEFVIGGWVMSDNAVTTYSANIDQMTLGHTWLKETFGDLGIPRIGWDIDPFGMSKNIAQMYKAMGFDYHVVARIDWSMKSDWIADQSLEFRWILDNNRSEILTHVMFDNYCTPNSMDFEGSYPFGYINGTNSPPITPENIALRAEMFYNITMKRSKAFRTNHLMFPLGCDFEYRNAELNFSNMTLLINYINSNPERYKMRLQYSLLSEYFDAIKNASRSFPTYDNDFFPYSDNPLSFWTGYYTSRPALKKLAREGESIARTAEILFAFAQSQLNDTSMFQSSFQHLNSLRSGNAYIQHHDAITGTERDHVIDMYTNYIEKGIDQVSDVINLSLSHLIEKKKQSSSATLLSFIQSNDFTYLRRDQSEFIPVILFNSLAWSRRVVVQIHVPFASVYVVDQYGSKVRSQIIKRESSYELSFETAVITPLGYITYYLKTVPSSAHSEPITTTSTILKQVISDDTPAISNSVYEIYFCRYSETDQRMCRVRNKISGIDITLEQDILQYTSYEHERQQSSGAYIFRAADVSDDGNIRSRVSDKIHTRFIQQQGGGIVQEVEQIFSPFAKQIIRLYNISDDDSADVLSSNSFIEIEYQIGEMDMDKELITQFSTSIESDGVFYTDNNAFTTMRRQYKAFGPNPATNSYYPTQYSSFITDHNSVQLTIVSDQSRGMSSQKNGQMEYMLHRRTSMDDWRGLERPLNDTTTVSIILRLFVDTVERSAAMRRPHSYLLNFPIIPFAIDITDPIWKHFNVQSAEEYRQLFKTQDTMVDHELPVSIHMLSMQMHSKQHPRTLLFRLQHIFEDQEQIHYSKRQVVNVAEWLKPQASGFNIAGSEETKLSGNQPASNDVSSDLTSVTLNPAQIRTYLLHVQPSSARKSW